MCAACAATAHHRRWTNKGTLDVPRARVAAVRRLILAANGPVILIARIRQQSS